MSPQVQPAYEQERLAALYALEILDTAPEKAFDEITQLAATLCQTPFAFVVLVAADHIWIKSQFGTPAFPREAARAETICQFTITKSDLEIIQDTCADERVKNLPLVTGNAGLRFYAGAPLITQENYALGTLCVMDQETRTLTQEQLLHLQILAHQVVAQLELRKNYRQLQAANQTLEKNLAFQKAILESISDGVMAVTLEGELIFCNKTMEKLLGSSAEKLQQDKEAYKKIIDPEFLAQRQETIRQKYQLPAEAEVKAFATEAMLQGISRAEFPLARPDGSTIPVELSLTPIKKGEGETLGFLSLTKDISDRQQAELQLKQSLAEISDLYDHAPCGYCSLNAAGIFTRINDTLLDWLGYSRDEIVGKLRGVDLYAAEETKLFSTHLAQLKQHGFIDTEIQLKRSDGSTIPFLLNATAEYSETGKFMQARIIVIDITERRIVERLKEKLYSTLEKANSQLEEQVQKRTLELRETISSLVTQIQERERAELTLRQLSHQLVKVQEEERQHIARELHDEIGQYLTALKLQLEMISHTVPAAKPKLLDEAQRLVNELIGKTRQISLNLRPPLLEELGLAIALEAHLRRFETSTAIQISFAHNGIQQQRFAPQIELTAYRIVQEALTNIARYAKVTSTDVRLWVHNNYLNIEIQDEGRGFDYQAVLNNANTSGLLSMRERANLLGGEFVIHTSPNDGTLISVTLPLS